MSAAFRDGGFGSMAIDRPGNDHRLSHSFVPLDLTLPRSQMGALNDAVLVGHIHLVPCGTVVGLGKKRCLRRCGAGMQPLSRYEMLLILWESLVLQGPPRPSSFSQ